MVRNQTKRDKNSVAVLGIGKHEPIVNPDKYQSDLIQALNYYNISLDEKDVKNYAVQYVKQYYPTFKTTVDKANSAELRQIGTLGRLIIRQQYVSPDHILLLADQLESLKKKYIKSKAPSDSNEIKVSVQYRIKENVTKYGAEVDGEIDNFIYTKSSSFDMKQFLQVNEISGPVAKKIAELYQPALDELSSTDPDIIEGYSKFTKLELRRFKTFIKGIIDCCNQHGVSAIVRKPRVIRAKPASVVTAKVQYLREYPELNLKSVDVTKLVGAREVWLYNVQYRKITVLRGVDEGALLVRGTSLYNYNVDTSDCKTIRDPITFFNDLKTVGKRSLAAAFKTITKSTVVRTRLNPQTIILAAF